MKRLLFLILLIVCRVSVAYAIKYNVYVKNADGAPLAGVRIYSFLNKSKAEAAYNAALKLELRFFDMTEAEMKKKYAFQETVETGQDGLAIIECVAGGSFIIDADDVMEQDYKYDFCLFHISDYQKDEMNFNMEFVIPRQKRVAFKMGGEKLVKNVSEYANAGKTIELGQAEVKGVLAMPEPGGGITERFGNKITISKVLDIDGEYARDDARFVAFPFIVFESATSSAPGDSIVYMPPVAVDGEHYSRAMVRRMGFQPSRDKLDGYRFDRSMYLQDHNSERFLYSQVACIEKGSKYHVPGILWYEDYNGVYQRDSTLFSDGKEREPMRFLDWSEAREISPIERERYVKKGTLESFAENASFKLQFDQGKSTLNMGDTTTVLQRDSMLRWLGGYDENLIEKIVIRGYSSPEGSENLNRSLSRSRAATIKSLLQGHFRSVSIETQMDDNDNIVTWQEVSDVMMTQMDDSVAHKYAARIEELVADKKGFDAQNSAIYSDKDLYGYLKSNVLDKVRRVEIEARIIVQKILTTEEIVERFDNDPNFRNKMEPYQYYVMICHLADHERWDDLYDVSKRAYEKYSKDFPVMRQVLQVPTAKDSLDTPNPKPTTKFVQTRVPYPLAGYYYAVSTLRKGMSDVDILKPYLDDGGVNRTQETNGLPFIVAQVLMYCQREDFDSANQLIKKYNLMTVPSLKGLIMFVRCLAGQYVGPDGEEVRNYVMSTSEMNKAVILTALGEYNRALDVLYGEQIPQDDAKVEYLKAICHFNMQDSRTKSLELDAFSSSVVYNADGGDLDEVATSGKNTSTWAAPMLNALRLDSTNVAYMENDGYFNNAYRQMISYFWQRLQSGVSIDRVAAEYDALVAQMRKKKAQMNK